MKESYLCIVFRIVAKESIIKCLQVWKTVWNKVWKYETLKELDKNRPNKEVAVQFNVPCSKLATGQKNKEKI